MPDERRLAAAVRADQGRMGALFDRETDPPEDVGRLRFVAVDQIFNADHRGVSLSLFAVPEADVKGFI
ncbi:MAG: hypothetical protein A2Z43_01370 [Syntrophobacterales bacterium RBG_19FT_COMBO_59_10]|nr:MAG: hypothetical protein A2Z43_01370 [Syntrophobacterales bacterium RBG_19FT_COMBO_59_10]